MLKTDSPYKIINMCDNITRYRNEFRRLLTKYIKKGVGIASRSYPFNGGTVLIYRIGYDIPSYDGKPTQKSNSLSSALERTELFRNVPKNISVEGTIVSAIEPIIVIIKDNNSKEWSLEQAKIDIDEAINDILTSVNKEKELAVM